MKTTIVKKHYRRNKNGVSVVVKHSRNFTGVKRFKDEYGVKTDIKVKSGDYTDAQGTSLALTESTLDKNKKPKKHVIITRDSKIRKFKENKDTLIQHELSHVLFREKKVNTLPEFKLLMDAVRKTNTFKGLKNNKYERNSEELFARIFSQFKTGDTSSNGFLFKKPELRRLLPLVKRLLKKVKNG